VEKAKAALAEKDKMIKEQEQAKHESELKIHEEAQIKAELENAMAD
jgi:hypothetical protein